MYICVICIGLYSSMLPNSNSCANLQAEFGKDSMLLKEYLPPMKHNIRNKEK